MCKFSVRELPTREWRELRNEVLRRDNFICQYCGKSAKSVDHILPKARGGEHTEDNLVAACVLCNNKKGDRTPEEAGMRFIFLYGSTEEI